MKQSFFAACCAALLLTGCKELPPDIILGAASTTVTDTTYVISPVPATDPHNVLVEEFTGQGCPNCPAGKTSLDNSVSQYPGQVNVISLYPSVGNLSTPPNGSNYDLKDSIASLIATSAIYMAIGQIPIAGIDRISVLGSNEIPASSWPATITSRLSVSDSLNLGVSSSYNSTTGTATIVATITYTQAVSTQQNLSLVVVEDSIISFQDMPYPAPVDSTYLFTDVFRDMVTSVPVGDPILDTMAVKEPGRFVQRVYTYKLPVTTPAINPAHCRVIAFVNAPGTSGDFHVIQSEQTKLIP